MPECSPKHLVRGEGGQVSLCNCGTVSLTFSTVTVRLSRAEFDKLAAMVRDAASHFHAAAPDQDPAGAPDKHQLH